ncbi:MAG: alpha/beta fold hydrolase, partial [Bryobacteraceae bacterium]
IYLQRLLRRQTRVCAYDRAGYGWSSASAVPRTSAAIANELERCLRKSGLQPPYILVGHSFGGFNVRQFAGMYPEQAAALVLIESLEEQALTMGQYVGDNVNSPPDCVVRISQGRPGTCD